MLNKECLLFMKKVIVTKKSKIIYQLIEKQRHFIIIGYIHNIYKLSILLYYIDFMLIEILMYLYTNTY